MNRADGLDFHTSPKMAGLEPRPTSFFSEPESFLDPRLFEDRVMHSDVRQELTEPLMSHLRKQYANPEEWAHAWLAGSGASYQWSAAREPGDLDVLVGVDYPKFRFHNDAYARLSDEEISGYLTDGFRTHLSPTMANWRDQFEVTYFSNPGSTDIRSIKPYAAYNLRKDTWDVEPDPRPYVPAYSAQGEHDKQLALDIMRRYHEAYEAMSLPTLPEHMRKRHIESMADALEQASALYTDIHEGRHSAFGVLGRGYADEANVRWQMAKANGVVTTLGVLHKFLQERDVDQQIRQYGVHLPSTNDLLLRAMVLTDGR